MSDLIRKARYCHAFGLFDANKDGMLVSYLELADRIEQLEAEVARLREALESIYAFSTGWSPDSPATTMGNVAKAALQETADGE